MERMLRAHHLSRQGPRLDSHQIVQAVRLLMDSDAEVH